MTTDRQRAAFFATIALFAALCFFAWRSGERIYETGPRLEISERGDGAVVFAWRYGIEAPMARRFRDAFSEWRRADRIIIDLDSPGGSLAEGRLVIDEVERMKGTHAVETRVGANAMCLSMCVPIYLAGERRTAAASAIFMFHEPTAVDFITEERVEKPGFEQRMTSARFFERYFVRSEMDAEWRDRLRAAWKGQDLWFTANELVAEGANVVEEISP